MNKFIEKDSLTYPKIRFLDIYMAGHKGFIAGGCFKNIFNNEKIKDIDVFFENELDFVDADVYFEDNEEYVFSYENKNTKAYKNKKTNIRVELVRSQYGTPEELLSKFDFSITKFAYCKRTVPVSEKDNDNLSIEDMIKNVSSDQAHVEYYVVLHENFFDDLMNKKLVLEEEIFYPVSTFERSFRYTRYGYGLCRESKKNLLNALKTSDIEDLSSTLYFGID